MKTISIILPSSKAWAPYVEWTIRSYVYQTIKPANFEVIVVEDGLPSQEIVELAEQDWPFEVRYLNSARERSMGSPIRAGVKLIT